MFSVEHGSSCDGGVGEGEEEQQASCLVARQKVLASHIFFKLFKMHQKVNKSA